MERNPASSGVKKSRLLKELDLGLLGSIAGAISNDTVVNLIMLSCGTEPNARLSRVQNHAFPDWPKPHSAGLKIGQPAQVSLTKQTAR